MNRCSFCNRQSSDVETLVAGAGVYICNDCVDQAASVIANKPAGPRVRSRSGPASVVKSFSRI
ncbi:MAG: ClpX C4-type zinc finger protein [Nocardioidaceae bacterium]